MADLDPPRPPRAYDARSYRVVLEETIVRDVSVSKAAWGDGLALEVTRPAGVPAATTLPAVVFVNGVGGALNEWEIYRSRARLAASRGLAGVTYESRTAGAPSGVTALLSYVAANAAALGIDGTRLATFACSANVYAALPAVMAPAPVPLRGAVFYYGSGSAPTLRKDLPVFWVLAGRDVPPLVAAQKALFARAVDEGLPWRLLVAPDLPHAFDALEPTPHARDVVRSTLAFLEAVLSPVSPIEAAVCREILAGDPGDGEAHRHLGLALFRTGKHEEAVAELEAAIARGDSGPLAHQLLADALAGAGRPSEAAAEYRIAADGGVAFPPTLLAWVRAAALAVKADEAFEALARLAKTGWPGRTQVASDPDLASLASDPRWSAALAAVPAPPAA